MSQHQLHAVPTVVEVSGWAALDGITHYDQVWSAWLHGSVAGIERAGGILLIVPVGVLTPGAVALAMRLYRLGEVTLLDEPEPTAA